MYYECRACGAIDSRVCNGDNEICTECGTIDDFDYVEDDSESTSERKFSKEESDFVNKLLNK